jgi:hypothetical protein|tara:strand:+ start:943 stop:1890 length:948 start_codon:yes stop_codon:yes gene_type:complete
MIIRQKRIMNAEKYLKHVANDQRVRLVVPLSSISPLLLKRAGFPADLKTGDTILPASNGPVSQHNAEGTWRVQKDLPKVSTYIMTRVWRWRQWIGRGQSEEHVEERDVYRDCYPRELVPPPSEELTYIHAAGGHAWVTSRDFIVSPENMDAIKHVINLLLELFAVCHIVDAQQQLIKTPNVKRVHWKMLPSGQHPWTVLRPYVEERVRSNSADIQDVIFNRQRHILSHSPQTCVVGSGGFHDYIAYLFPMQRMVILESVRSGNALYIFEGNWERFARLTKAEILSRNLHIERIIHAKGWQQKLDKFIAARTAKQA